MKHWIVAGFIAITAIACNNNDDPETEQVNAERLQLVENLNKQVSQYPDSAPIRMRLAMVLDSLGRYNDAIAHVDSLIKRDSLNNGLWYNKARLLEFKGDTAEAIRSYQRAIRIYPSLDAQLSLANLLAEAKDQRALLICQQINALKMGREADAHCNFIAGIYYARTGNQQAALDQFEQAINNNYTYMEAYMEKGFVHFDNKNYQQALEVFEKAITVNNTYADAYYWKAKTHEAMGNKEEAILNYQRSIGLDKSIKEAREALKRLENS